MMRKLKINRTDFELYFEESDYESAAYLDSETGKVLYITEDVMSEVELLVEEEDGTLDEVLKAIETEDIAAEWQRDDYRAAARILFDGDNRYRLLPKQDSRVGYRDMEDFIAQVEDENLRELLEMAIDGSGAFRRFKDTLRRYPQTEEAWFKFQREREQERMMEWFELEEIEPEFE